MRAVLLSVSSFLTQPSTDERGLINMAMPPPDSRALILFGGPRDGDVLHAAAPPPGYRDFAGALVVWHLIRVESMPLWQGHQFERAVRRWSDELG